MRKSILLLATVETKKEEIEYLQASLAGHGIEAHIIDVSLGSKGKVWGGEEKLAAMEKVGATTADHVHKAIDGSIKAVVGLGGGTGGEIILHVMRDLPFAFPKMLITTLPFDPRIALADNAIILVPTLADICGLNAALRQVLHGAAAMLSGLCATDLDNGHVSDVPSIGMTALGATSIVTDLVVKQLRQAGQEATVFHANGYGGAAFTRFIQCGAFKAVIDLTCHELTRLTIAGAHVPMKDRFSAAAKIGLPQVVLPGGINFIGLGEISLVPPAFLQRPHYRHTGLFTHIQVTADEMERLATVLAGHLNSARSPVHLILPMGGFSHQDAPGGAIEAPKLRDVFATTMRASLSPEIEVIEIASHINDSRTAACVMKTLRPYI